MRIILTCPNCGSTEWEDNQDAEGAFVCKKCNEHHFTENMVAKELSIEEQRDIQDEYIEMWMRERLMENFDCDEDTATDIANEAFQIYSRGDGHTQYEAITEAYCKYGDGE